MVKTKTAERVGVVCAVVLLSVAGSACGARTTLDETHGVDASSLFDGARPSEAGEPGDGGAHEAQTEAAPPPSPRPIAPLSTSFVTSQRPTLRWVLPSGVPGATVELCQDHACSNPVQPSVLVMGTSYTPTVDLPAGVIFWRLLASSTHAPSATWQFTVRARSAPIDTSWGTTLDVNGDGYADLAVSDPGVSNNTGAVYIYVGSPSGLGTIPAKTILGPNGPNGYFGGVIASAGDVNGDGYADLLVAAPAWTPPVGPSSSPQGNAYVYYGGPDTLASDPSPSLTGALTTGSTGGCVASAGDVNGDGYGDIALTVDGGDEIGIYLGSASGIATAPSFTIGPGPDDSGFGWALASADVNGDGLTDLIVGSPYFEVGRVHVYLGTGTGFPQIPDITLVGPEGLNVGTGFGRALATGDVNGDGFADLVVGGVMEPERGQSSFYLYLGGEADFAPTPSATLGSDQNYSVVAIGDVNGDGYDDVLVNAYSLMPRRPFAVEVYLGAATSLAATPATTIVGSESDPLVSIGDVHRDGFSDVAIGFGNIGGDGGAKAALGIFPGSAAGIDTTPSTMLENPKHDGQTFGFAACGASD
jgi:hypothetical protein